MSMETYCVPHTILGPMHETVNKLVLKKNPTDIKLPSHWEKQISYINTYMWNLEKSYRWATCKAAIETQT